MVGPRTGERPASKRVPRAQTPLGRVRYRVPARPYDAAGGEGGTGSRTARWSGGVRGKTLATAHPILANEQNDMREIRGIAKQQRRRRADHATFRATAFQDKENVPVSTALAAMSRLEREGVLQSAPEVQSRSARVPLEQLPVRL